MLSQGIDKLQQSSTLEVGYFCLHARTGVSTSARAAEERVGAVAIMFTISLLERTSQICQESFNLRFQEHEE